ncbi:MAG TPA: N-acetylmuramoyl-L-alanine amidase [Phycicoccus sp.]|nr:N-acetylmuramoyl-L-alanine amidase [Phycicoccus sp.]
MDWTNLIADEDWWLDKHYTPGRGGRRIDKTIIHHNAGRLSLKGCYDVWQTRPASAHYQVDVDGRIGQYVHDWDTSWNAANTDANQTSIAIEHANSTTPDSPVTGATLESGAHLVAAIHRHYDLGRPAWLVNVFPHNHYTQTGCPGHLAGSQNSAYMARAQAWYDAMGSGTTPTTPSPQEDDMALTDDDITRIAAKVTDGLRIGPSGQQATLASFVHAAARDSAAALRAVEALRADLAKVASGGVSADAIVDAVVARIKASR